MADLFNKKEGLSAEDYILKYSLIYLGMKAKAKDEGKFRTDENK